MGTVDKALNLLSYFTLSRSRWGLSELARASQMDKATVLRLLRSLQHHRMIEQDGDTKLFRLGTAFINLARVREQSFPLASLISKHLEHLAQDTGETAHASLAGDSGMTTIAIAEPQRSTRVNVDPSETLPFHATASGLAWLAFNSPGRSKKILSSQELRAFTAHTVNDPDKIRQMVAETKRRGYGIGDQSFEAETVGLAVPIFDSNGNAHGAIAVASPTMRMNDELHDLIVEKLFITTIKLTEETGGMIPSAFSNIAATRAVEHNERISQGTPA